MLNRIFQSRHPLDQETSSSRCQRRRNGQPCHYRTQETTDVRNSQFPTESCGDCEFWYRYHPESQRGACRPYPPSPATIDPADPSRLLAGHFPQSREDFWCGEYQPRPV